MITLTYRTVHAVDILEIDDMEHDIADILEVCRKRIFPDAIVPARDEGFERAMAITRGYVELQAANSDVAGVSDYKTRTRINQDEPGTRQAFGTRAAGGLAVADALGPSTGVRDTSRDALDRHAANGKLGRQEMAVYGYVRGHHGEDFTRQEIARGLDMGINAVCGRVHALINDHGMLRETRKRKCRVTGETVMAIGAV